MKTDSKSKHALVLCLGLSVYTALGHDAPVHEAITYNAAASAHDDSPAYSDFLDTVSSDIPMPAVTNAMVIGSRLEDSLPTPIDEGGYRSINHFYDPLDTTYGKGLSDVPPDTRKVIATNSFMWGSVSNCFGLRVIEGVTSNRWSWPNARGYEWLGLTATNQSDRFLNLSNMFRAVGQVMHLLEDTSQPQHVRNEQHLETFPFQFVYVATHLKM